ESGKFGLDLFGQRGDLGRARGLGRDRLGLAAGVADANGRRPAELHGPVGADDVRAESRQSLGRRLAYAGGRAQHDGRLARQIEQFAIVGHVGTPFSSTRFKEPSNPGWAWIGDRRTRTIPRVARRPIRTRRGKYRLRGRSALRPPRRWRGSGAKASSRGRRRWWWRRPKETAKCP